MKKTKVAQELRRKAEAQVTSQSVSTGETDVNRLLHELQVHQIELEMQNEELRQANVEISEHKEHLANIIKKTPAGYFHLDLEGHFLEVNDAWLRMHGYDSAAEVVGKHYSMVQVDDSAVSFLAHLAELQRGVPIPYGELSSRCKDGSVGYHIFSAHPVEHMGTIIGFDWFIIDINEKKRMLEEIVTSRAEFEAIFNAIPDGIVFVDVQRRIVRINPAFTRIFGYQLEEIAGQTTELIYADSEKYLKQGQARFNPEAKHDQPLFENEYLRKDGSTFPGNTLGVHVVDENGELLGYVGVIHDATEQMNIEQERLKLENLLRQSQKMEAIGTMAGGIAHDFNNLLTIIGGNLEIVQFKLPSGTLVDENLEDIRQASVRAKSLVAQILAFSRQEKQILVPINLSRIISESLKLLRPMIPTTVEIVAEIPEKPITINADKTQLHQVLINLCSNAIHAMDEKGLLRIRLEESDCKMLLAPQTTKLQNGQCAKLSVSDNGKGMDRMTVERIFEPFYTTKEVGVGTGMGLSVAHGIIEQHGGLIEVNSSPGQGTTFTMIFPLVSEIESEEDSIAEKSPPTGTERILVVDDEEFVADVCGAMLVHLGYKTTVMTKSATALEFFRRHRDDFDLVITDQTMPGLSGVEFAKELLRVRPDLPIILCSGYSAKVTEETAMECGIHAYCSKPIELSQIATTVRNVLDAAKLPPATGKP